MKATLLTLTLLAFSFAVPALACSPLPPLAMQQYRLKMVLESPQFNTALDEQQTLDPDVVIEKIEFTATVDVRLSNGCVLENSLQYDAPLHPGLCPSFRIVVTNTVCGT